MAIDAARTAAAPRGLPGELCGGLPGHAACRPQRRIAEQRARGRAACGLFHAARRGKLQLRRTSRFSGIPHATQPSHARHYHHGRHRRRPAPSRRQHRGGRPSLPGRRRDLGRPAPPAAARRREARPQDRSAIDCPGQRVLKYGQTIGFATDDIAPGDWVHSHNLTAGQFDRDYAHATETPPDPRRSPAARSRATAAHDGHAGTRNYIAVISTVNCSASVSQYIVAAVHARGARAIIRTSTASSPSRTTAAAACNTAARTTNSSTARWPASPSIRTSARYLLIGLGCETGTIGYLWKTTAAWCSSRQWPTAAAPPVAHVDAGPRRHHQDDRGRPCRARRAAAASQRRSPRADSGQRDRARHQLRRLRRQLAASRPTRPSASPATCSSPAAARPSWPRPPEIYGAEHLLTRRAKTPRRRPRSWSSASSGGSGTPAMFGAEIDNNPSPGNKEGGLTTIYEKSLGAIAKAGSHRPDRRRTTTPSRSPPRASS